MGSAGGFALVSSLRRRQVVAGAWPKWLKLPEDRRGDAASRGALEHVGELVYPAGVNATVGMPGIGAGDTTAAQLVQVRTSVAVATTIIGAETRTTFETLSLHATRNQLKKKHSSMLATVGQDNTVFVYLPEFRRGRK